MGGTKILDVVKDEGIVSFIESLNQKEINVDEFLLNICEGAVQSHEKDIIQEQLRLYKEWNDYRETTLEKEYRTLVRKGRKEASSTQKKILQERKKNCFSLKILIDWSKRRKKRIKHGGKRFQVDPGIKRTTLEKANMYQSLGKKGKRPDGKGENLREVLQSNYLFFYGLNKVA